MTDTTTPAPGTSTPTGATNVAEAQARADAAAAAPAPAEAPAKAPAAPAPAAPAPLDLPTDTDEKGAVAFAPTGHKNLDASLEFLGKKGFGPNHPAMVEAANGNFALLDAQIAEKNIPGGEAYVRLAKAAYEELQAQHETKRTADKEALFGMVGGEDNWKQVAEWGKANATPEQTAILTKLLNDGGEGMKIAASWLAGNYQKATGGVPETDGAGPRVADTRGTGSMTSDALSPQEYGRATEAARRTHKGHEPFESSDTYRKLVERRSRWKA